MTDIYDDEPIESEEKSSRTRYGRRKQTWKKIRRNIRISVKGEARKGGGLLYNDQPHRLYKGPNWNNIGKDANNTNNLGPSTRDKRHEVNAKEQMNETDSQK